MTPDMILAFVLVGLLIATFTATMLLIRLGRGKSWYARHVDRVWNEDAN